MSRRKQSTLWQRLSFVLSKEGIWKSPDQLIAVGGLMGVICVAHVYFLVVGTFVGEASAYYLYLVIAAIFFGLFSAGTLLRVLVLMNRKSINKKRKQEQTNRYTRQLEQGLHDE
ncbi:hypothetical protein Pan97_23720 [Bremerella volcania]|uniref:Uncharacterized protein n=1 Tax=Bremerella volcania TaxID=2527984 RepID=A0A518C816_9BACT|nr:hypothetical protein [Bremerella volcania]QDU75342.1 hypothetical protein Pan97_23720 [Bremerella volcania]